MKQGCVWVIVGNDLNRLLSWLSIELWVMNLPCRLYCKLSEAG